MNLIILAAGYGTRLSPATEHTPKALLKIDNNKTILDKQLESAKICGIKDIIIVAGFAIEQIEEKVSQRKDLDLNIKVIYNPFYRTYNNLVSLWTAMANMNDDFIMLNGDNVFKSSILNNLKNEAEDLKDSILIAIAKKSIYDEDDTKLVMNNNKIVEISKGIPYDKVDAEWIGMCAICGISRIKFIKKIQEVIRIPSLLDGSPHYLSVFQGLADDGVILNSTEIEKEAWSEVDYLMDLEYVRSHITRFKD